MTRPTREQLLEEFKRDGQRTYKEASHLLDAWGFRERKTRRTHVVWTWGRHTLTLSQKRVVRGAKAKIIRTLEDIRLEEENHD